MGQCQSIQDVHRVISNLVDCFEYMLPAIEKGIYFLIFDARVEEKMLRSNEHFKSSVSNLAAGGDQEKSTRRLWYMYTRNRSIQPDWDPSVVVSVSAPAIASTMSGTVSESLVDANMHWLSFGGTHIGEAPMLIVNSAGNSTTVHNSHDLVSFKPFLPIYEKSDKHRTKPYIDTAGDHVSQMTLTDIEAQKLLLISVQEDSDRIGYHEDRNIYCRFKNTRLNIYHGFEVNQKDIAADILTALK